jgi:alkylated DNA repair dioxygenase AlkB
MLNEVPGLYCFKNFLKNKCKEVDCCRCKTCVLENIDAKKWLTVLNRRTQHYGARYDYTTRKLHYDVDDLDGVIKNIARKLNKYVPRRIECVDKLDITQCIVNEYTCNQRISAHIDNKCFGPVICSISLGNSMTMRFKKDNVSKDICVNSGDLLVLTGDARYLWTHELLPETTNKQFRRVSLTYREM